MEIQQKITPFLWFDKNAVEAAEYYVSVFGNGSKIKGITPLENTPSGPGTATVSLSLMGQDFTFISGGPFLKINEAVSFVVNCGDQKEVDYFWEKLSAVKEAEQCGWCKDKFGVSWQIVPVKMFELLSGPDKEKAARAGQAMLKMKKIELDILEKA